MDQTTSIIFFFAAILIFGGLLFAIIALAKRTPRGLDVDKYRSQWMTIEQQLKRDEVSSYSMAIMNADKLLDRALQERGLTGRGMADRLKQVNKKLSNANAVWAAHKLRNRIAHESDVRVEFDDARRALMTFKQALKDMGAI